MKEYRLVLVGFGNVGKAFARLLLRKRELLREKGIDFRVTGIRTGRHGAAICPDGMDLQAALDLLDNGGSLDALSVLPAPASGADFIRKCPGDVMFETTPVNVVDGQPAIGYIRAALESGMHAVTANKGTVVHGFEELIRLARETGRHFYYESAVMDGAPIFSLFRETLPLAELRGFHGILNSTTNLILERMDGGETFDQAVKFAQQVGLAETEPSMDVDGWDAAIKVAALVTVLMGQRCTPQMVEPEGIRGISPEDIRRAKAAGKRWKLVCSARREADGRITTSVGPEMVGPDSTLYSIRGSSSYAEFELDTLPGLGVVESNPSPETTAYGMFADWLNAIK